jgi:hypothetical protein
MAKAELMTDEDIAHLRLHTQRIAGTSFDKAEDAVRWLGAVQAQDYPAAKWALGQRVKDARDSEIEQALTDGAILRTHVMRPTWHFVLPEDIRWLLALTAPHVKARTAYYERQAGLDDATFARSNDVMRRALQGGKHLTRAEIASRLQEAGIETRGETRLGHIMGHAELDAVVCSGPRRGKQFTYALLEERAPRARTMERDEALAELARRYFTGHGPATVNDYMWWSGLAAADARASLDMAKFQLVKDVIEGKTYWLAETTPFKRDNSPTAYLLPNYDEFGVGYKDRSAMIDNSYDQKLASEMSYFIGNLLVVDGRLVGAWKRTFSKDAVVLDIRTFTALTEAEHHAVEQAANRYGDFLGMPVILS